MNKLYTSALAGVLVAGSAMAQTKALNSSETPVRNRVAQRIDRPAHTPDFGVRGTQIWCDDFSTPSNWVESVWPGAPDLHWQIGTGLSSQGGAPIATILSTTAENGFALLDSDAFANEVDMEKSMLTTANPIDLSSYPNVVLEFESQYRKWTEEECFVVISTNNTDWPNLDAATDISALPNVYYVWPGMDTQDPVDNPTLVRINISNSAGNQPQVWVRFHWTGIYGYSWYVDDVCIREQAPNEIAVVSSYYSHTGLGEEYGRTPASQLNPTMLVGAEIENSGVSDQTNVSVTTNVAGPAPFSLTLTQGPLAQGEVAFVEEDFTTPTLTPGLYNATATITSDAIGEDAFPDNNVSLRNFEVTEDVYSLDGIGNHPEGAELLGSIGTPSFLDAADGLIVFTYYPIINDFTVAGIEMLLSSTSVAGGSAFVSIHDTTNVLADIVDEPIVASSEYVITENDIAAGVVRICFDEEVVLPAGGYYAAVEMYSNENLNDWRILDDITVPQPALASAIFIPADQVYTNGNALAIRMSGTAFEECSIGVKEEELAGISIYPNPSEGMITVNAASAADHTVQVMNLLGEVVATSRFNVNTNLDLTDLAKGVYTVRVSTAAAAMVQRVTLN